MKILALVGFTLIGFLMILPAPILAQQDCGSEAHEKLGYQIAEFAIDGNRAKTIELLAQFSKKYGSCPGSVEFVANMKNIFKPIRTIPLPVGCPQIQLGSADEDRSSESWTAVRLVAGKKNYFFLAAVDGDEVREKFPNWSYEFEFKFRGKRIDERHYLPAKNDFGFIAPADWAGETIEVVLTIKGISSRCDGKITQSFVIQRKDEL